VILLIKRYSTLFVSSAMDYWYIRCSIRSINTFSVYYVQEADENDKLLDQKHMSLEFASYSDGKGAVAKAANLLFTKYITSANSGGDQEHRIFTEAHMTEALRAVGLFYFSDVLNSLEN
jgi:hypothetical protein